MVNFLQKNQKLDLKNCKVQKHYQKRGFWTYIKIRQFFSSNYDYLLKDVEINQLVNLEHYEINKYFNDYKNKSIFLVPINKIYNLLNKNKWIDKISIKSDYNSKIYVKITEKIPAGIFIEKNKKYFFDKNGTIIDSVNFKIAKYNNLIIFSGKNSLPNANIFLEFIPVHLKNEVKEAIYINFRRWDIKLRNGIYLKLSENNILESFIKYDKIYKNISASELKEIKSIDLRIPKQAIIKFKN